MSLGMVAQNGRQQMALTCIVSAVVSSIVTTLALVLMLPASSLAQPTAVQAESVAVVTTDGEPRAILLPAKTLYQPGPSPQSQAGLGGPRRILN